MNCKVMQVHHFRYGSSCGGVDRVVTELLEGSDDREVVLFEVGEWKDRTLTYKKNDGLSIYRRRLRGAVESEPLAKKIIVWLEFILTLLQLILVIKRERIDVIHLHTLQNYHAYFVFLARLRVCPYIVTLHGSETLAFPQRAESQKRIWNKVLCYASVVTAVSLDLSKLAEEMFSLTKQPSVVYNGISSPENESDIDLINRDGDEKVALCVGALRYIKGHDVAIRAWKLLHEKGFNTRLLIAGEGEYRRDLEKLIEELNCNNYVTLLGNLEHKIALSMIGQADLFVMPSRTEGLGVTLIEAMALETPICASDLNVFKEMVSDKESANLFCVGVPESLAQVATKVLSNTEETKKMTRSAQRRYGDKFTRNAMVETYKKLYRSIL